jgi:hypothetical protein
MVAPATKCSVSRHTQEKRSDYLRRGDVAEALGQCDICLNNKRRCAALVDGLRAAACCSSRGGCLQSLHPRAAILVAGCDEPIRYTVDLMNSMALTHIAMGDLAAQRA